VDYDGALGSLSLSSSLLAAPVCLLRPWRSLWLSLMADAAGGACRFSVELLLMRK